MGLFAAALFVPEVSFLSVYLQNNFLSSYFVILFEFAYFCFIFNFSAMFLISFTYIALCDQQYQVFAPAVEVGIVTARGGGLFT